MQHIHKSVLVLVLVLVLLVLVLVRVRTRTRTLVRTRTRTRTVLVLVRRINKKAFHCPDQHRQTEYLLTIRTRSRPCDNPGRNTITTHNIPIDVLCTGSSLIERNTLNDCKRRDLTWLDHW